MQNSCLGHKKKKRKEKKNLFYGRMDLPSRAGRLGVFFFFFSIFGSKNDPKNTKVFFLNLTFFAKKNLGKTSDLFQLKFSDFDFKKMPDFTRFWKKKYLPKRKIWVGRTHKAGFFLFFCFFFAIRMVFLNRANLY